MKRNYEITPEQQEFRNKILGKKVIPKKTKKKEPSFFDRQLTTYDYIDNCVFWLKQYRDGLTTKERVLKSIQYLKGNCDKLIQEIQSKNQNQSTL